LPAIADKMNRCDARLAHSRALRKPCHEGVSAHFPSHGKPYSGTCHVLWPKIVMKSLQSSASRRFTTKPAWVDSATDLSFELYRRWYNFQEFLSQTGESVVQKPEQHDQRPQKLPFSQGQVWRNGGVQSCMTYTKSLALPGLLSFLRIFLCGKRAVNRPFQNGNFIALPQQRTILYVKRVAHLAGKVVPQAGHLSG
jgi:hypothetical protein